jgi:molybdopterin converting factor small subunit
MEILVKGYLTFKKVIGEQVFAFPDSQPPTLRVILSTLLEHHGPELEQMLIDPETGEFSRQAAILVNGRHHTHIPEGLESILQDGDQIAIFPPLVGG